MKHILYLILFFSISCSSVKELKELDKRLLGLERQIIFLKKNIENQHKIMEEIEKSLGIKVRDFESNISEERPISIGELEELKGNISDYDKALNLYKSEKFEEATIQFERFLKDNPSAELTPDALYYLGSSHFKLANYLLAIIEFQKLTDGFTKSNRVPDGLLKLILSYKAINDIDSAKSTFSRLTRDYPESEATKTALSDIKLDSDEETSNEEE